MTDDCGCGCAGDCDDTVQAAQEDVFKTPQEAMKRARELGCDTVHTHRHEGETLFMPCSGMKQYEEKTQEKEASFEPEDLEGMYEEEEEEESKKASCDDECPPGFAEIAGECVAVTCELALDDVSVIVEASTGMSVIRMSGVAFTSGYNKNGWQITKAGAKEMKDKMIGADITLNHPHTKGGRFTRNMTGGVDEAVVGIITEAKYEEEEEGYKVRFTGEVYREELFSALESGLWLRAGYGVSIGGTGIPIATEEDEKGRMKMTFESDFAFDHLAIVHKPAYADAKIESAERVQTKIEASAETSPLIYRKGDRTNQPTREIPNMSEEEITIQASEESLALKEELVLAQAKIAAFEKAETEAKEAGRLSLVSKATEMGLAGVDEFSSEMLERVIASWEASRPAPKEMIPATPAAQEAVVEATEAPKVEVVANYLNGELVESEKSTYGLAWNAWAAAWNGNLSSIDKELRAPMFDEIKEMI
tara:strand:- start:2031 stop:3464 length:1434 start_codon:yes stop_codon:yes gene_type:complete